MPGAPLSLPEREEIFFALTENPDGGWAEIVRRVERHPTRIAREVTVNGGRHGYRPATAQARCDQARRRPRPRRLSTPGPLRDRVTAELCLGRSPVAVVADLDAQGDERVCVETRYTAVYTRTLDIKPTECLRSRRPRRRSRQARRTTCRPGLPNISARPAAVNDRSEPGHWEADQIIGARNRSSMLWLTERLTRFSIPVTMPNGYNAADTLAGLVEGFERSMTSPATASPHRVQRSATCALGRHGWRTRRPS
ncbi:MAG: IS30 family transposase [Desertimonas sp.]